MSSSIIYPDWKLQGVHSAFSTVQTSDMGINTLTPLDQTEKNRQHFLNQIGLDSTNLAIVRQIHGTEVLYADRSGILGEADGLITNVVGLNIGILVADCAAVLVCDPINRVIGAFHAGWRGAAGGILVNGINRMREIGGREFHVWLSPCIGLQAFEVGEEVARQFPPAFVDSKNFDKPHVDLKAFLIGQLQDIGVHRDRIFIDSRCTYEDTELYSYRRQGKESGRMLGVIGLV